MGTVTVLPTQGETFTRPPTRFDRAAQLVAACVLASAATLAGAVGFGGFCLDGAPLCTTAQTVTSGPMFNPGATLDPTQVERW